MPVSQAPHQSYQTSCTNGVNFRTLHVNRPLPGEEMNMQISLLESGLANWQSLHMGEFRLELT